MAIVRKPKGFLFDEPLANLDAPPRVNMRIELSRLHKELGTTMIYVTHDPLEAMTMGDRIAVFNKGHIKQLGAPRVDGAQHLLSAKVAAGQTPIDTGHVVGLCPDARWALRFDANARRVA